MIDSKSIGGKEHTGKLSEVESGKSVGNCSDAKSNVGVVVENGAPRGKK